MITRAHPTTVTGVDAHTHVLRVGLPLVAGRHSQPAHDATADDLLGLLDRTGLSHAVITAPSFYGADNSLLLATLAATGDRLVGTVQLAPDSTTDLTGLPALGVRGIRFNLMSHRPDDADLNAGQLDLVDEARRAGLHVEVLVPPAALARIGDKVLARGATLVVDHFGLTSDPRSIAGSFLLEALAAGRTWVKLSAPYRLTSGDPTAWSRRLLATRPDRLVWGSDWPWVSYERDGLDYPGVFGWLSSWVPDLADRHCVLVRNPTELFGLSLLAAPVGES